MTRAGKYEVAEEVIGERLRQDQRWGEQNHPDGTGVDWAAEIVPAFPSGPVAAQTAKIARLDCQRAAQRGKCTWLKILREEVAEAFAETDPVKLRTELIQVAAVAQAWAEAIDRRAT